MICRSIGDRVQAPGPGVQSSIGGVPASPSPPAGSTHGISTNGGHGGGSAAATCMMPKSAVAESSRAGMLPAGSRGDRDVAMVSQSGDSASCARGRTFMAMAPGDRDRRSGGTIPHAPPSLRGPEDNLRTPGGLSRNAAETPRDRATPTRRDASFESSSNALAFGSHEATRADSARPPHRETRQRLAGRYPRSESAKRSPPASGPREAIVSVRRSRCSPRCATRFAPACPAPAAPGRDSCGRRGRCSSPRCSR